jgi:uncharacterized protein (DUF2147 family)
MRVFIYLIAVLGLISFSPAAHAQNAPSANTAWRMPDAHNPIGLWLTANGNAVVQIAPCGQDLCGQIVGLVLGPNDPMPTDWTGAPQCGLTIFRTAPRVDANGQVAAWSGSILDPRNGSQYSARIKLSQPNQLELRGYLGLPIFGRTQTWSPYRGSVPANCRLQNAPSSPLSTG